MIHFHIDATRVHSDGAVGSDEDPEEFSDLASGGAHLATHAAGIARAHARSQIRAGDVATFAVETEWLHFFDPATGAAVRDQLPG
jgi:hypothetical protein